MLNCSAQKETTLIKSPISIFNSKTLITSFLPRQLLINSNYNHNNSINMNSTEQITLNKCDFSNQRVLILQSISQFLQINGFSKTLKNFLKEANFQKDEGGSCSLDIEEMCFEYLKLQSDAKEELGSEPAKGCEEMKENGDNDEKKVELPTENEAADVADVKSKKKKKKKKSKSASGASEQVSEETLSKAGEIEEKKSEPPTENDAVDGDNVKSKNKKSKSASGASEQVSGETLLKTGEIEEKKSEPSTENDGDNVKSKKKKKKKNKTDRAASEQVVEETQSKAGKNERKKPEPPTEISTVEGKDVKPKKQKSKTDNGASEHVTEVTESKPVVNPEDIPMSLPSEPVKKSKDKKKKLKEKSVRLDKDMDEKQSIVTTTENVDKKEKKENKDGNGSKSVEENVTNSTVPSIVTTETGEEKKESKKRKKPSSDENNTGHVEKTAFDDSKRRKTDNSDQSNGKVHPPKTPVITSAEPKTVKAFQRVKPEDVEFADERLQDNSYWAKDGADSGYGAKAQEVLGQVRGRDFRHEKTKKKRGSYRGGQIDLHTHSVKFNYENEDE